MLKLTLESLKGHFLKNKLDAQIQEETQQLYIIFRIDNADYPLFIRIYESGDLLQLLIFLPYELKKAAVADTARLLHLINKEIDVPGFGIDEISDVMFYRAVLPCFEHSIDEAVLNAYINSLQIVCKTFSQLIGNVAAGATSFDQVFKKVKEAGSIQ